MIILIPLVQQLTRSTLLKIFRRHCKNRDALLKISWMLEAWLEDDVAVAA